MNLCILRTIAYFDMFRYPVTADEIRRFLVAPASLTDVETVLEQLCVQQKIFRLDEYYSLQNDLLLANRRREGNALAGELLQIAFRIAKRLYKFPFVRGVGISGSLSKNYADADADIDFFIITRTGYLWITRSLLHILKKFSFLAGKQHWYCMNYFIDESSLVIAEKNIFTATEVVTLKPVCGEAIHRFYSANQWAFDLFPNYATGSKDYVSLTEAPLYKNRIEKLFVNRFGRWLDDYLMQVTARRWLQKEQNNSLNSKGDPLGLMACKHFARPNPQHLQKKLLGMFNERLCDMENKWGVSFNTEDYFFRKEII